MAQHVQVPKFGNWETNGSISYTQYFEIKHSKGRGVNRPINPNNQNHEFSVRRALRSPPRHERRSREQAVVRKSPPHWYPENSKESPSWERKSVIENHVKSRAQGSATPERGSGVPKFGEWDVKNSSCGDGYTQVFNRVRNDRRVGSGPVPISPTNPVYIPQRSKKQHHDYKPSGFLCFGWCK